MENSSVYDSNAPAKKLLFPEPLRPTTTLCRGENGSICVWSRSGKGYRTKIHRTINTYTTWIPGQWGSLCTFQSQVDRTRLFNISNIYISKIMRIIVVITRFSAVPPAYPYTSTNSKLIWLCSYYNQKNRSFITQKLTKRYWNPIKDIK